MFVVGSINGGFMYPKGERNLSCHSGHGDMYGDTSLHLLEVFVHHCKSKAGSSPVGTAVTQWSKLSVSKAHVYFLINF